ncbi:MAG: hypothetical protein ACE5G0_09800 [Rhodothermales bacterium]
MPCTSIYLFLLLILLSPLGGRAQTSMEGGARASALGGANTALTHEVSAFANPAAWATLSGRAVSFSATEAFGLSELRLGAVEYAEPTRLGTFAGGARTFGFDQYRETHFHAGYARGFRLDTSRRFSAGLFLRYQRVSIPNYGHTATLGLGLGGLVDVLPSVRVGFTAANLMVSSLSGREKLARSFSIGLAYLPVEGLLVVADVLKEKAFPFSIRAGLEVQPVPAFFLRVGATTEPTRFTAGAGVRLGKLVADLAGEHHEVLGWSPAVSFGLRW